jgi:hypothetical protein
MRETCRNAISPYKRQVLTARNYSQIGDRYVSLARYLEVMIDRFVERFQ